MIIFFQDYSLQIGNCLLWLDFRSTKLKIYAKLELPLVSTYTPTKTDLELKGWKLILTTIKYIDVNGWYKWKINDISIFTKFVSRYFIYCTLVVSWIRNLLIYQIWRKMKCVSVSCPDDCFDIFTSRSNNIYSSIILLTVARVKSFIQCYNQCCIAWNCGWYVNIDSVTS